MARKKKTSTHLFDVPDPPDYDEEIDDPFAPIRPISSNQTTPYSLLHGTQAITRCSLKDRIPRLSASSRFKWGSIVDLKVIANHNPTSFYVHIKEFRTQERLETLARKMAHHYRNPELLTIHHALQPLQLIAAWSSSLRIWRRGEVVNRLGMEEYEVFLIDYGIHVLASTLDIRHLHVAFSHLEAQAVECALGGIISSRGQSHWSRMALKTYRVLCSQGKSIFIANRYDCPMNDGLLWLLRVVAESSESKMGINVNDELVKSGHALSYYPGGYGHCNQILMSQFRDKIEAKILAMKNDIQKGRKGERRPSRKKRTNEVCGKP